MRLHDIIDTLSDNYWLREIGRLAMHRATYSPTKEDFNWIEAEFEKCLSARKTGRAINWAVAGFLFYHDEFLSSLRKKGWLRPSKHIFNTKIPQTVVASLLKHSGDLGLPNSTVSYLESLSALLILAPEAESKVRRLLAAMRDGKASTMKGMMATIDMLFMTGCPGDKSRPSSDVQFYNPEVLAEALSYIINLYHCEIEPLSNSIVDERLMCHDVYLNMVIEAAHIRILNEVEILVDTLDYHVFFENRESAVCVIAPTPEIEKAHRSGFISHSMHKLARQRQYESLEVLSLQAAGEKLYESVGEKFVHLKEKPFPRYVFEVPLAESLQKVLTEDDLFREELFILEATSRELMTDVPDLLAFEILPGITLCELLKVQRSLNLIRSYQAAHFKKMLPKAFGLVMQSLVPSFTFDKLNEIIGFVVGKEKAAQIIDFLSWAPESGRIFDIQYQPLVKTKHGYLVPMNILSSSHVIRNSLCLSRLRLYADGVDDPLPRTIGTPLRNHTTFVAENVLCEHEACRGEIDVMASLDGQVFIFECKNSLIPCNTYELRTSYDAIQKAAFQLDKLTEAFQNQSFTQYISRKIQWDITFPVKPVTCIVVGNWMFSGYRVNGHAVRGSHELASFIEQGTIAGSKGDRVNLWTGEKFTGEELRKYLVDDSVHKKIFSCMEPYVEKYQFGDKWLHVHSYCLNGFKLYKTLGLKMPEEGGNAEHA